MFILSDDWDSSENPNAVVVAHNRYMSYLEQNRSSFPASAYEFATAKWHHDFSNNKALHDSMLANVSVDETGKYGDRSINIEVSLLGAFQDGHLNLNYQDVSFYQLGTSTHEHTTIDRDEIRLSENGRVLHEIVWWQNIRWLIECADIKVDWAQV